MRRARWVWLAAVGATAAPGAFIASCSDAGEAIGFSSAPLTVGAVVNVAPSRSELTGDWTPSGPAGSGLDADILCIASNGSQWSWSQDHGANWTVCNNISPSCNGDGGQFSFDSGTFANWFMQGSDQTLVADKLGHVVWVSLADPGTSGCNTARGVVAMVSSDGGKTFDFPNAVLVNDNTCSNGCQDQPDASFDYSTSPPTLVVSWRHQGVQNPPGAYGACTRRYFVNASNILQPMDDAYSVDNLGLTSIGAVRVRAGGGVMTIVYTTTDDIPRCPNTGTSSEGVASLSSYDWGDNWTPPATIFSGSNYTGCLLSGQVESAANPRNFDYVRAVDGTNYVVYQDTKSTVRLFMDTSYGAQINDLGGPLTWREWCPGTPTADGGPTTNWLSFTTSSYCATPFYTQGQASVDAGSGNSLAMPVLAADDQGRLATWFYEADSTDTMFHVHFRGNVSPRSPTSTWTDVDVSPNFMPGKCDGGACGSAFRTLGDYQAMLVQGGLRQPTCGNVGTFFPAWSFANSDAGIDAFAPANPQSLDAGLTFP